MGLDAYLIKVKNELAVDDFTFHKVENEDMDICYWRKNYELQSWMKTLFYKKGGKGEFNGVYIRIKEEDLDNLIEYAKNNSEIRLDYHRCFLDDNMKSAKFINLARESLKDNYALYYASSW
jgi:hypothetical protein